MSNTKHARYALRHKIYRQDLGEKYPLVEHTFYGKTKDECEAHYKEHLRLDRAMRSASLESAHGTQRTWAEIEWEELE